MINSKFRNYYKRHGVRLWEICDKLHISEPTMSRILRHELDEETLKKYMAVVDEIATEREEKGL